MLSAERCLLDIPGPRKRYCARAMVYFISQSSVRWWWSFGLLPSWCLPSPNLLWYMNLFPCLALSQETLGLPIPRYWDARPLGNRVLAEEGPPHSGPLNQQQTNKHQCRVVDEYEFMTSDKSIADMNQHWIINIIYVVHDGSWQFSSTHSATMIINSQINDGLWWWSMTVQW